MEPHTESTSLAEQAESLLINGQVREAADAYARLAQLDPNGPAGHLGVAEANLALGQYGMAYAAARHVQQIAPQSAEAVIARALLAVLDRRYEVALRDLDEAAIAAPGRPYIHALRGYCFRRLGNTYDASLAESKAARLSGSRELNRLFPQIEPVPTQPEVGASFAPGGATSSGTTNGAERAAYQQRTWSQRTPIERQMVRMRFATRGPVVTYTLIAINTLIYLIGAVVPGLNDTLLALGEEQGAATLHDPSQFYRLLTAMFLHLGAAHILLNMVSLFSVGTITETIFGSRRFLAIYIIGGLVGGLAEAVIAPTVSAVGASGAIFAIFGAFGAFALLRRRSLGPSGNAIIGQWIFFLILNLLISFAPGIGSWDHIGGLVSGFLLGALAISQASSRGQMR